MKVLKFLAIVLPAVTAVAVLTTPAQAHADQTNVASRNTGASAATRQPTAATSALLRAQATANGLTPLQTRSLQGSIEHVIARTGGTQVAINQVAWDGGDTLIPLPGETRARELGVTTTAGTVHGCGYYQFCTYGHRDFTGMVDRISSCTWHVSHGFFVAYVNNQTPGTRARFYDYYRHYLAVSQPAFSQDARFGNDLGHQTHYIRPC